MEKFMKKVKTVVVKSSDLQKYKFKICLEKYVQQRYAKYLDDCGGIVNFLNKFLAATRDDEDMLQDNRNEFSKLMSSSNVWVEIDGLWLDSSSRPVVSLFIKLNVGPDAIFCASSFLLQILPNGQILHTDSILAEESASPSLGVEINSELETFLPYIEEASKLCRMGIKGQFAL